jgi:hypothetical protein
MTPSGIEPATFRFVAQSLNPLNAELNPICHLLALLGAHHILHVSRIRVNHCANISGPLHSSLSAYICNRDGVFPARYGLNIYI